MSRRLALLALCFVALSLPACSRGPQAIFTFPFGSGNNAAASDSVGARMAAAHSQPRQAFAIQPDKQ